MKIEVITDTAKFKELRDEWDNLLMQSNSSSIFLTWEWLYYWWKHFKGDKELFILLIRDEAIDNRIIGIAPFCIKKVKLLCLIPIRKIGFLGAEEVASDFLDFIICPGAEEKFLELICEYLKTVNHKWDIVEIDDIDEASDSLKLLRKNVNYWYKTIEEYTQVCPYIKLPKTYELFLQSSSQKMRRNLKYYTKKLKDEFNILFTINKDKEQVKENIDKIFMLHHDRFNSKDDYKKSTFSANKIKNFHYDVAFAFAMKDWLKFYFLNKNNESIASLYAFKYKNAVFIFQSGFNPEWEKLSVGTVTFGYAIKDSVEENLSEFHLLRGNEDYKFHWTKNFRQNTELIIWNNCIRAKIASTLFNIKRTVKKFIKNSFRIKNTISKNVSK